MAQQRKLGEILLEAGVVDEFQLRSALGEQQRWGRRLGVTLIKMGFLEERDLVCALARQMGLPVAHLEGKRVNREILDLVPPGFAEQHMCVPLFVKEEGGFQTLYLGMEDPSDLAVLDDVSFRTGMKIRPVMVGPSDLCEAIDRFYRRVSSDEEAEQRAAAEPDWRMRPEISLSESLSDDDSVPELVHERDFDPPPESGRTAQESPAPPDRGLVPASVALALRALSELLIEKGVVTREELRAKLHAVRGG